MKLNNLYLIAILLALIPVSCTKDSETIAKPDTGRDCPFNACGTEMVLGRKLDNPYSVDNMRKAYEELSAATKAGTGEDRITATHRYVKFIPKNEEELALLKVDSSLVLFQYPLDYEIISYGSYRDPCAPEGQPTPLYCSVPVGKSLPEGVEAVVLEDLFIPDEPQAVTKASSCFSDSFVDALVEKSFELTGNREENSPQTKGKSSKWVPQGSVIYYDMVKNREMPVEGLQVRCNRWFTTYTAYTDANGAFKCKDSESFKNPANYSIVFERYDFEIRDAWLSTARCDGPKMEGPWNVDLTEDKLGKYYSTIFRAAYKYYYGNIHGLSRPPQNSFWKTQLKIKASTEVFSSLGYHSPGLRFAGLGSAIHIYTFNQREDVTYATTLHELAHAVHWGLYKSDYNNASDFVLESWTRGIQVYLTRDEYPKYDTQYSTLSYTGIVRDMMDGTGLRKYAWYYYESNKFEHYDDMKSYTDNVSGYTMIQVEASLKGSRDAESWKTNLKKFYDNETEENLDDAFAFWSTK